jgi:hypothetical protein
MNSRNIVINISLAVTGVALWSFGASRLAAGGDLDFRPNPLGLKMSPYGQVIALAVQGGIDSDWHGAEARSGGKVCGTCGHDHSKESAGQTCDQSTTPAPVIPDQSLVQRLESVVSERTNPRPATSGHKFYLRRQVEDRLRFAFELDPSNYANYNSYHLFLTEPAVGTRRVLTSRVMELARLTISYSLREESDPRPALTAASAAGNILELMFLHRDNHSLPEMQEQLQVLDFALERHRQLATRWIETGDFQRLSVARQNEMLERLYFVTKVRDAAAATIERLSAAAPDQASLSR